MRPGHVVDEALQELGRRDAAGAAPADILHVRRVAGQHLVVGIAQRHAPGRFADGLAGRGDPAGQLVIVGEQAAIFAAERDDDRAGKRRQVDHEFRLEAVLGVPERVGEHEPALGVGVEHLDGLARHGGDDVAGPLGGAGGHVLDQPGDADRVAFRLAPGQRLHQADYDAGAAHVPLHVFHAGGRLDRDAAGIESDALADEGDRLVLFSAALPLHDQQLGFAHAALADAEQRAHAEFAHGVLAQYLDLDAEVVQGLALGRQGLRVHDVGRLRNQVAGQEHAVGQPVQRPERLARRRGGGPADGQSGERRLLVGLLLGAVAVEAVAAQPGAEAGPRRRFGAADLAAVDRVEQQDRGFCTGAVQGGDRAPAGILRRKAVEFRRLAQAEQDHPVPAAVAGARQNQRIAPAALEAAGRHGA